MGLLSRLWDAFVFIGRCMVSALRDNTVGVLAWISFAYLCGLLLGAL